MSTDTEHVDEGTETSILETWEDWYHIPILGAVMLFMVWVRTQAYESVAMVDGNARLAAVDSWYHWRTVQWTAENYPYTMPYDIWTSFPTAVSRWSANTLAEHYWKSTTPSNASTRRLESLSTPIPRLSQIASHRSHGRCSMSSALPSGATTTAVAVELTAQEMPDRIRELDAWGTPFDRTEEGAINQRYFGAQSYRRTCFIGDRTGEAILETLIDRAQALEIPYRENVMITRLLSDGDRVSGAVGFDMDTAEEVDPHEHVDFPEAKRADDLVALERVGLVVHVLDVDARLLEILGEVLGHALGERRHERSLVALNALVNSGHQVVDLAAAAAHRARARETPRPRAGRPLRSESARQACSRSRCGRSPRGGHGIGPKSPAQRPRSHGSSSRRRFGRLRETPRVSRREAPRPRQR